MPRAIHTAETTLDQFRGRLQIDRDNLDECVMEQADLYFEIADQVTLITSRRDEAELVMKQKIAELTKQYKIKAERADEKATVASIAADVENSEAVRTLRRDFLDLSADAARWSALRGACDQRKDMLKVMGQLYASQYFTRASVGSAQNSIRDRDAMRAREAGAIERKNRR